MRQNRKLREIAIIAAGQGAPQGEDNYCVDGTPFIKAGNLIELINGKAETEVQKVNEQVARNHKLKKYPQGTVLFAKSGMSCMKGYVYQLKNPCYVVSHLACIIPKAIKGEYLKYYFEFHKPNSLVKDEAYPSISLLDIGELSISYGSEAEQEEIVRNLDKINRIINKRRLEIQKIDDLVKSQFIEMFGDPVINEKGWTVVRLSEVAEMKIGPFGSLLHKEDYISGGHALVNPSHIEDGKIQVDNSLSISDEKYNELSAYHLKRNDIVLGRRGEMGRCAVVNNDGLLCGTGSMIIRPTGQMLPYFLQSVLSSPSMKLLIEERAVGVTMANLNVPIVSNLPIPMYPMEKQRAYISILEQTDKSKFRIKQSLEKLEKCYKALLQKYFG